jgi:hypothetical protein
VAGIIVATSAAGGGKGVVNPKPTMTYNAFPGVFNITNNDATANYSSYSSVTSGTLAWGPSNTTVTLSAADSTATVANRRAKGTTTSPSTLAERKSFSYTYVAVPNPTTGNCYPFLPAGGTRYSGQWMAFYGSPYTYLNGAPGYTQAPSEWYKIT